MTHIVTYRRWPKGHGQAEIQATDEADAVRRFRNSEAFRRLNYPHVVRVGRIGKVPIPWHDHPTPEIATHARTL